MILISKKTSKPAKSCRKKQNYTHDDYYGPVHHCQW